MIAPGPRNLITDVPGLRVGNAEDDGARTGVSVILPDDGAVMAADVRGAAPGTRETDALEPTGLVKEFHGLVLAGGSVFGLAAADGVCAWLSQAGRGLEVAPMAVPVVPAAILFDLNNGGDKDWGADPPYYRLGRLACDAAAADFSLGNAGAGMGATAGRLKGGLGSASAVMDDGLVVGALFAVNSFGQTVMPGTRAFWAWPFEQDGEFGGQRPGGATLDPGADLPEQASLLRNTTIGAIATNAALTKSQARQLARMAHTGLARAVRPVQTPFDGDTVFTIATGEERLGGEPSLTLARLGQVAADCAARAIARGVYEARSLGDMLSYRDFIAA